MNKDQVHCYKREDKGIWLQVQKVRGFVDRDFILFFSLK